MTAVVLLATSIVAWGGNVTFKAKLDSATLLMGKTTALHLEITQEKGARGFFPNEQADTLNAMVEIAERPAPDTTDLGNNRIQINRDLIIQSFDSGMWVLQPLPLIKISSRDLQDLPFLEKGGINFLQIIFSFPCSILFTVIVPHHLIELNNLTPRYSLHLF